jgi:dihydroorotate dehydrogenase (fumarate)
MIEQMSDIFNEYPINYITCINSLGNGLVINPDNDQIAIRPKDGLGGIGGSVVKPFALANVYQFRKCLSHDMDIVGCGGIDTGRDIYEHILVGATAVQIGSTFMKEGVKCFERLTNELKEIMQEKGYNNLDEFRGMVKTFE